MAGLDYLKCNICGTRILYLPNRDFDTKVVCMHCYKKASKKIETMNKMIKRNR